jgi:hypothetical protein
MRSCEACLHWIRSDLANQFLDKKMAEHKENCTNKPSEKDKRRQEKRYVIDLEPWQDFEKREWMATSSNPRKRWEKIRETVLPSEPADLGAPSPSPGFGRDPMPPDTLPLAPRRESIPPPLPLSTVPDLAEVQYVPGPGLAPIQNQRPSRTAGMLPGVAELTSGVSPYSTSPAVPNTGHISGASQGPLYSTLASYSIESAGSKRRASPDEYPHEANQRSRFT